MEWNRGQVTLLIDLYREHKVLWDPSDCNYKNRNMKHVAWMMIAATMDIPKNEVEAKMRKLIGQFQREEKRGKSGSEAVEGCRKWFAYKLLLFLKDKTSSIYSKAPGIADENIQADTRGTAFESEEYTNYDTTHEDSCAFGECLTGIVSDTNKPAKRFINNESVSKQTRKRTTFEMAQEAFSTMKHLQGQISMSQKKDEFDVFGECVARTLRNLKTKNSKVVVKHKINNLLFNAELGYYDEPVLAAHCSNTTSLVTDISTPSGSVSRSPVLQRSHNQVFENNDTDNEIPNVVLYV